MDPTLLPDTPVEVISSFALVTEWIVQFVHDFGYFGIFIMTFIESTFIPIPSEVTMVPAGYLIYQGEMNGWLVVLCAVLGTVFGALFNYWIAWKYGRVLIEKYGKYFLMTPKKMEKMEQFFEEHGAISTFNGRLIPGVRHYISFPAGLARMNLRRFVLYTALGGAIWMLCLLGIGYFIGQEEMLIKKYLAKIISALLVLIFCGTGCYVWRLRKRVR